MNISFLFSREDDGRLRHQSGTLLSSCLVCIIPTPLITLYKRLGGWGEAKNVPQFKLLASLLLGGLRLLVEARLASLVLGHLVLGVLLALAVGSAGFWNVDLVKTRNISISFWWV
ncbi:hypothetical protein BDZ91DRAFT_728595 [Kalaharituber pfeilii]|nr:hypothetical protein BDZ91DRAFT_728595 [Kalaharituber pfeilii]